MSQGIPQDAGLQFTIHTTSGAIFVTRAGQYETRAQVRKAIKRNEPIVCIDGNGVYVMEFMGVPIVGVSSHPEPGDL